MKKAQTTTKTPPALLRLMTSKAAWWAVIAALVAFLVWDALQFTSQTTQVQSGIQTHNSAIEAMNARLK